jgi:hypothetical protein
MGINGKDLIIVGLCSLSYLAGMVTNTYLTVPRQGKIETVDNKNYFIVDSRDANFILPHKTYVLEEVENWPGYFVAFDRKTESELEAKENEKKDTEKERSELLRKVLDSDVATEK